MANKLLSQISLNCHLCHKVHGAHSCIKCRLAPHSN